MDPEGILAFFEYGALVNRAQGPEIVPASGSARKFFAESPRIAISCRQPAKDR